MRKITAGCYELHGWEIYHHRTESGGHSHWTCTPRGESFPTDAFNTKGECVAFVNEAHREDTEAAYYVQQEADLLADTNRLLEPYGFTS